MNIAEKLTTIAENEQKVYNAGYDKGKTDFGVVATEKGTSIRIDHINDAEDVVNVKLSSKNILPYPYATESQTTYNGLTITINDDGSVTFNGETPMDFIYLHQATSAQSVLKNGKTYTQTLRYADGSVVPTSVLSMQTYGDWIVGDTFPSKQIASGNDVVFTVEGSVYDGEYFEHQMLDISIIIMGGTYDNVTVYPQIEENTSATPYTPYVADVTSAKVTVQGRNLLPYPYYSGMSRTENGVTFTANADGSITINGTPTATAGYHLYMNRATQKLIKKGETYTISLQNNPNKNSIYINNNTSTNGSSWNTTIGGGTTGKTSMTYTITEDFKGVQLYIVITKNAGLLENVTIYPQLELGGVSTDYESYKEPTQYTPNEDGTLEIPSFSPTMTLLTDKQGVNIECEYYQDGAAAIQELTDAIINLGGTI